MAIQFWTAIPKKSFSATRESRVASSIAPTITPHHPMYLHGRDVVKLAKCVDQTTLAALIVRKIIKQLIKRIPSGRIAHVCPLISTPWTGGVGRAAAWIT
jgi:hypothetical protein